jgi:dTDP-4-dehydrorhamnose reductase
MRVMLLGAGGQVGTEIRRRARVQGFDLLVPDRGSADLAAPGQVFDLIRRWPGLEGVINAAAYTAVDRAEAEPELAQRVNGEAPGEIAEACRERAIPLVHYSTDFVFGESSERRPLRETEPTEPLSVYGNSKLAGERAALAAGGCVAVVRLSWVFSAHGRNFLKTMLRLGGARDSLNIVDDQFGRPTSALASARAGLAALKGLSEDPGRSGVYHFASSETTSWARFAEAIFAAAGMATIVKRIGADEYPTPAQRPSWSVLDPARFCATFGVAPGDWRGDMVEVLDALNETGESDST